MADVVFIDSGIGGMPYYNFFVARNPRVSAKYVADSEHFPYGPKSKDELTRILTELCSRIIAEDAPKIFVIACNAGSVSALDSLRKTFPRLAFVGTVPAVKPAILENCAASDSAAETVIGVLGTERTVNDPYIDKIVKETGKPCTVIRLAAPELINFIEHDMEKSPEKKYENAQYYVRFFAEHKAKAIVLGCTHFLLLLDEFTQAASPCGIKIYHSVEGVCKRTEELVKNLL